MNKSITFTLAGFILIAFCTIKPLTAQTVQSPADSLKPIPDEVLAVFKKACVDCHAEPGKTMALSHFNITKWNEYTSAKQVEKATAVVDEVSKGKMPPKHYIENNPTAAATTSDLKILTDWVERLSAK
jgi:cytochrome c551/c552